MEDIIHERIYVNPEIHFGKPCIKNTRIPVYAIIELVQEGIPFDEIINNYYPDITKEDIKASLEYAAYLVREEEIHLGQS